LSCVQVEGVGDELAVATTKTDENAHPSGPHSGRNPIQPHKCGLYRTLISAYVSESEIMAVGVFLKVDLCR
jgi:hypothetical protein